VRDIRKSSRVSGEVGEQALECRFKMKMRNGGDNGPAEINTRFEHLKSVSEKFGFLQLNILVDPVD